MLGGSHTEDKLQGAKSKLSRTGSQRSRREDSNKSQGEVQSQKSQKERHYSFQYYKITKREVCEFRKTILNTTFFEKSRKISIFFKVGNRKLLRSNSI